MHVEGIGFQGSLLDFKVAISICYNHTSIIYIQTTKTNYNESYIPKTPEKGWGWVKEEGTTEEDSKCTCKTRSHLESWLNFDFFIWTLNASANWWRMFRVLQYTFYVRPMKIN